MKLFIALKDNNGMDSIVDERFGRANYFAVYDLDKDELVEIFENSWKNQEHGVGIKTSTIAIEKGCDVAIGAKPGPKAEEVLRSGKMDFFEIKGISLKQSVEEYKKFKGD